MLMFSPSLALYGVVGEDFTGADVSTFLAAKRGPVEIHINSGGGMLSEGLAIYNLLRAYAGRKTIYIDGIAASSASLIAMAGDDRVMREGAMLMVHEPSMQTVGTSEDHRKGAAALQTATEQVVGIYVNRTGRTSAEIAALMTAETWMDAQQAVTLGFATRADVSPAMRAAAFDYSVYRHVPAHLAMKETDMSMSTDDDRVTEKPWAGKFMRSAEASGLELAQLNAIVADAPSLEKAKDLMIDAMAKAQTDKVPSPIGQRYDGDQTFSNPEFLGKAVSDAIYARMTGRTPDGPAREFASQTLLQMGVAVAGAAGRRVRWSLGQNAVAAVVMDVGGLHTTSDFPSLLQAAGQRHLQESYQVNQSVLRNLARERTGQDFRPMSLLRLGEAPALSEVDEGAEITHGTRAEAKEGYRIKTFAKLFSLSRQALINDDLSAFADSTVAFGRAAAECEANELVALFTANSGNGASLDDGQPFYTTVRGNKAASGAGISVETLSAARLSMRSVKGLDGKTPINAAPKYLVVGPALETAAEQVLTALYAAQVEQVNPFSTKLTLAVEPRFVGNAWRLFADPGMLPGFEIAYLNGVKGPQVETKLGWTVLGQEFRVVMDIGCGLTEWRASYLNPGQ